MTIPEVSDYFKEQVVDAGHHLVKLIETGKKKKFIASVNKLIDEDNLLYDDGFLTLFGLIATELYKTGKANYLYELNYFLSTNRNKEDTNVIELEVLYNCLEEEYDKIFSRIKSTVEIKSTNEDFKDLIHDRLLDIVFFYYKLHRRISDEELKNLTYFEIQSTVENSLEIVTLFKDLLTSPNYKPNQKYTSEMFDHYFELIKKGQNQPEAGYNTLEAFFGKDEIKSHKVSVDAFCKIYRQRKNKSK